MKLPSKLFKLGLHGGLLCREPRHITRHIHRPSWRGHKCTSIRCGVTNRGAATLVLCTRSCALNVESRGGAGTKTSMVGACSAPIMGHVASTGPW